MGYSKEIKRKAFEVISERRLEAERDAANRRRRILEAVPEAEEYERRISACSINAAKLSISGGGDARSKLEFLRDESLRLQDEYEKLLWANGYSASDMEPKYFCKKCGDKGFVELDNRSVMCSCFKNAMVEAACEQLNRSSPLKLSTFEDFDLRYYSMDIEEGYPRSAYDQMSKILSFCKKYAETFSLSSGNIFMKGFTGLGKTHLSLAIANEVIRRGFGVIYASAPTVVGRLEKEQFSRGDGDDGSTEQTLLDCDLLIIDDLGTEFSTNFSNAALYNLFNSRLLSGKPMIISTNLSFKELKELYSERFVSRIIGEAKRLDFFGADVRILKK